MNEPPLQLEGFLYICYRVTEKGKCIMKIYGLMTTFALILFEQCFTMNAQTTAKDGDWSALQVVLRHTQEAEHMIRVGDVDNLNSGWERDFNPFPGRPTSVHSYPSQKMMFQLRIS
jgi:hypothetical protein